MGVSTAYIATHNIEKTMDTPSLDLVDSRNTTAGLDQAVDSMPVLATLTAATSAIAPNTMKATVYHQYGTFGSLNTQDVATPSPKKNEVRIRVRAAALHVGDCFAVKGEPFLMRFATGLLKPKSGIPGFDVSGIVESVGQDVTRFRVGDEVFGAGMGTCAEFACTSELHLALKPDSVTFEQAAALPTSGLAALHALRDTAGLKPAMSVLINGASGGVGSFAVQIAKSMGAEVTGVCSTGNVDLVRSLGADNVIDYTKADFTRTQGHYDVIFDNVENRDLAECRNALKPNGTLILNSGTGAQGMAMLVRLIKPLLLSPFVRHDLKRYLSLPNNDDLATLGALVHQGKVDPVIDSVRSLDEVPSALAYIDRGHARGKVIVRM